MGRSPSTVALVCLLLAGACSSDSSKRPGLIGADCVSGGDSACSSGKCLILDSNTAYCSQECQAAADCPTGYLCAFAPSGGQLCQALGAGGVCSIDDDCPAGLKCDAGNSHCYIPVTRSSCGPCTSDLQCGTGGSCHAESTGEHFCSTPCAGGACSDGYTCKSGQCLPTSGTCRGGRPLCAPCAGDLECGGPGDLCVRNLQSQETFCGVHCTVGGTGCLKGFTCTDLSGKGLGPDQCVPDSGTCAGYCDADPNQDPDGVQRECGLGSTCDIQNSACKRQTNGTLCAACNTDDDCTLLQSANPHPDSRCVQNRTVGSPYLGEQFCGQDCTLGTCTGAGCQPDQTKCGPQFNCAGIGANGAWPFQCVPIRGSCTAGFARLGDSCDRAGSADCLSGICAQFGSEKRCSSVCLVDGDCGDARWRCCAAVGSDKYDCSQAPANSGGICAPVGGSFGDDCAPGSPPCQEGLCLDLGTAQLCTRACDSTHTCSAGFSCQSGTLVQADGSAGSSVSVCFPDGGGGVGSACAFGPAACKSHLCLKKDSGNVCTQACTAIADCPSGWDCADVKQPDLSTTTVCVPPGVSP